MQIRSKICKRPRKITEKLEEKRKTKGSRKRILNSTEKHKHRTTTRLDYFLCVVRSIYFFLGGVFRCLSYAFCKPQRIMHEFKLSLYCFSQPSGLVCVFFSSLCRHSCTHRKIGMAMHICIVWLVQVTIYIAKGVLSWIYDTFVLIN